MYITQCILQRCIGYPWHFLFFYLSFLKHVVHEYCIYIIPLSNANCVLSLNNCSPLLILLFLPIYTCVYVYNLVSPFSVAHMHMYLGLTAWDYITYQEVQCWRRMILPFSEAIALHLGLRPCKVFFICIEMLSEGVIMQVWFK